MKSKKVAKSLFELASQDSDSGIPVRKAPPVKDRGVRNVKVASKRKVRPELKISAKFEVSQGKLVIDLPLRTKSEANCFEPWQKKHARHKMQQRAIAMALNPHKSKIKLPCSIMLTRFAPHELDTFDNLPMSFKFIVDAICAIITGNYVAGKADSDKRITIACDQVKSKEYGIRIAITF